MNLSRLEHIAGSRSYEGPAYFYLTQIVSHFGATPLGAAHIQPCQGPLADVPERNCIAPCEQFGFSPEGGAIGACAAGFAGYERR